MKKVNREIIVFAILSIVSILVFSWTTSPFCFFYAADSDCFKLMGKMVAKGLIPYKDFFDHKGPLISFIELVGYGLLNNTFLLVVMQITALYTSLIGLNKTLNLITTRKISFILTIVSLVPFMIGITSHNVGGNNTEEWSLPFISFSIYFFAKFLLNKSDNSEQIKHSLFYGIAFAVCAGTRITNGICIFVGIAMVFIILLINKQYLMIIKNGIFFSLGILLIVVPVIIYYCCNDAFYDMIYGTFLYNIKYATDNGVIGTINIIKRIIAYIVPFILLFFSSIYLMKKKEKILLNLFVVCSSFLVIMFYFNGAMYAHYMYSYIPILMIGIAGLLNNINVTRKLFLSVFAVFFLIWICLLIKSELDYSSSYNKKLKSDMKDVSKAIDDDRILAYNVLPSFYLETNKLPIYKNFHFQDFQCKKDKKLKNKFRKDLISRKADWIIVCNGPNIDGEVKNEQDGLIRKLSYKEYYKNNSFILLRKGLK